MGRSASEVGATAQSDRIIVDRCAIEEYQQKLAPPATSRRHGGEEKIQLDVEVQAVDSTETLTSGSEDVAAHQVSCGIVWLHVAS